MVHSVDPSAGAVTTMEHHVLHIDDTDKRRTATEIAARDGRVIMFLDTKHAVDRLTKHLLNNGVRAAGLHGGKSQPQRTRTLTQFKDGHVTVLVATNVAARGIHVDDLGLVVNVDPPGDPKDYLHRGGRTARAGESGSVITLVTRDQRREVGRLMAQAGVTPRVTEVRPGDEELSRITGARTPSGVPVVITVPEAQSPRRTASAPVRRRSRGGRGGRPGARPHRTARHEAPLPAARAPRAPRARTAPAAPTAPRAAVPAASRRRSAPRRKPRGDRGVPGAPGAPHRRRPGSAARACERWATSAS
ncbi:hypothetical protein GCM10020256_74220 [Streptomyces thermocoprophilus]